MSLFNRNIAKIWASVFFKLICLKLSYLVGVMHTSEYF